MATQATTAARAKLARTANKSRSKILDARLDAGAIRAKAARAAIEVEIDPRATRCSPTSARPRCVDRYLLAGETPQHLFARVSRAYADDAAHAQRLYDYMSRLWFLPATPILSNGGTERGLPISCFLNSVEDNLDGIVGTWTENVWLASNGGGIGTYWGGVRSIGETVKGCGQTSGIIPFVRVMDSLTLAISQGSLRRGSAAVYLDVLPSGDRGVHRDPQAVRRLQPQEPEPAPRRLHHRRVHAGRARRSAVRPAQPEGRQGRCARSPRASSGRRSSRRGCRRASPIYCSATPRTSSSRRINASSASRCASRTCAARSCSRRAAITSARRARRCAASRRSTSRPGTSGTRSRGSSKTCFACSTTCCRTSSTMRRSR